LATSQRKDDRDFAHQRELMVDRHVAARGIKDERVLQAMREVPRHLFVPQLVTSKAYGPGALPIGAKQTISQPYIVARMLELLELRGTMYGWEMVCFAPIGSAPGPYAFAVTSCGTKR